jgi:hypothetical protein
MGWTLFTTTFLWTPTMRMFLKPDVSQWSLFGLSGSGREGAFWVFPTAAGVVLLLFYLEGRGRLRPLVHAVLLAWHLPVTAGLLYGAGVAGPNAVFVGAAWGWEVRLALLAVPFVAFTSLAVVWIAREVGGGPSVERSGWTDVDRGPLVGAAALVPVATVLFRLGGEGFDALVRLAIAATILQWVLLCTGLNGRTGGAPRMGSEGRPTPHLDANRSEVRSERTDR